MMGASAQQLRRRFTPFPGTLVQSSPPSERLRILAVGSQGDDGIAAALHDIERWSREVGIESETASDLPAAVRQLAVGRWDLVLIGLGERALEDLTWGADSLRGAEGAPPLVAMIEWPSMSFVHEAEKLGVRDVLTLPIRH